MCRFSAFELSLHYWDKPQYCTVYGDFYVVQFTNFLLLYLSHGAGLFRITVMLSTLRCADTGLCDLSQRWPAGFLHLSDAAVQWQGLFCSNQTWNDVYALKVQNTGLKVDLELSEPSAFLSDKSVCFFHHFRVHHVLTCSLCS